VFELVSIHNRRERRNAMKYSLILAGVVMTLVSTGCMSGYYAHRERRQMIAEDTVATQPVTVDDVIAMTKDNVGDDVILAQIKATRTYYHLTSNDIRDLKKSGVSDRVISAMIKTADEPGAANEKVSYARYPDYFWYPYPSFYDPWYSPVYLGYSFRSGYYGGYRFGGGHSLFHGRRR
jgi:hypothetical protein